MKKTLVFGATPKSDTIAYKVTVLLLKNGTEIIPWGIRTGKINGLRILMGFPFINDIHTITIFIDAEKQKQYYDYFFSLNPERIILNPGTENKELKKLAKSKDIEVVENCTMRMITGDNY
jgi:predicted CoA-binding protein